MRTDTQAWRFGDFLLVPAERTLSRDGARVDLGGRALDALALLVAAEGRLVTKDRFMADVWAGVPVTDEALTQCIRTIRRALGDDAAAPRFVQTVPRHGYRFAMAATAADLPATAAPAGPVPGNGWPATIATGGAGTLGAALVGLAGGIGFGAVGAAQAAGQGSGAGGASVFLVLLWLTIVSATAGGAGIAFGIAVASRLGPPWWRVAGGAAGGLMVGAVVRLIGLDAFQLLLGRSPAAIAGGLEGLVLGIGVGAGAALVAASPERRARRLVLPVALAGGAAGLAAVALGGALMAGSFGSLAQAFPDARLGLDSFAALARGGPLALLVAAGEGALFATGIVGAMALHARRVRAPLAN